MRETYNKFRLFLLSNNQCLPTIGGKIYAVRLGPDIAAAAEAQGANSEMPGVSTLFQSPTSQSGSLEEESSDSTPYAVRRIITYVASCATLLFAAWRLHGGLSDSSPVR